MNDRAAYNLRKVRTSDLSPELSDAIWRCYRQFVDCPRSVFERSLAMAEEVYLCYDSTGTTLCGFQAMRAVTIAESGSKYIVVYTFYADLEPHFRGLNILQRIALRRYLILRLQHPLRRLYWMFTASTCPSYLLLPHNLIEYWPHPDHQTPTEALGVMASVVEAIGLKGWDAHNGVLRRNSLLKYREGVVSDRVGSVSDRFIQFYSSLNPGQNAGDSLVCLFPLNLRNFLFAVYKMISRKLKTERGGQR